MSQGNADPERGFSINKHLLGNKELGLFLTEKVLSRKKIQFAQSRIDIGVKRKGELSKEVQSLKKRRSVF